MKVMLSQPMRDKTKEEILKTREMAIKWIKEKFPEDNVEILDTYFQDFQPKAAEKSIGYRLEFLGKSISDGLAKAHAIVFINNWKDYIGCASEEFIARKYGIPRFYITENGTYIHEWSE
jgi:hydroxymethylpyrimidine pyrophosphatase-like HAD family hydrolase